MADKRGEELSARDAETLARLVAKYGRKRIVSAAQQVPHPARAGRRRDEDKRHEMYGHIEWIDMQADFHRISGQQHVAAMRNAVVDRFLMVTPRDKQTDSELQKFKKRIKAFKDELTRVERAHKIARARLRA